MDIRCRQWSRAALDCTAPDLAPRLGSIIASHEPVGKVHRFYVDRYGFNRGCAVIAFSGDNPNSLAGLRLRDGGDIAISLGTSDTMFGSISEPVPSASEGHIFANPVDPNGFMAMICYKNGSLTRESVRDAHVDGTWPGFNAALAGTSPVNDGYMGFYFREPEITPPILATGTYRFDPSDNPVDSFLPQVDARAVLETQFLSMRSHSKNIGLTPGRILATGGASQNLSIIKVMAHVMSKAVSTTEVADSAALGAAYRALHGWKCKRAGSFVPFSSVFAGLPPFQVVANPDDQAHDKYSNMLQRFTKLEKRVMQG